MKIIELNEQLMELCEEMKTRLPRDDNEDLIKRANKLIKESRKLNIASVIVDELVSSVKKIVNSKQVKSISDNIIERACERIVGGKSVDKIVDKIES